MVRKIFYILVLGFLFCCANALGQNISVSAPEVIAEGQQIEISYTFNSQNIKNYRIQHDDKDLKILNKSNPSRSNKRINSYYETTFIYQCIPQVKNGEIKLPIVSAVVDGKANQSPDQTLTVVPKTALTGREDYAATFTLNQNEAFQGELVYAEIKLYFSKDLNSIKTANFSEVSGLTISEIPLNSYEQGQSLYKGKLYNHAIAAKFEIKTDSAGTYNFPELTVNAVLKERVNNGGIFSTFREKLIPLTTDPVTLRVIPVDVSERENYLGVFSDLSLESELPKSQVDADQALNLNLVLSGTGSFETIKTPRLQTLKKHFSIYDPEITEDFKNKDRNSPRKISYKFTLVPLNPGMNKTNPLHLYYFNTTSKALDSLLIPSFSVNIMDSKTESKTIISEEKINFTPVESNNLKNHRSPLIQSLRSYWLCIGSIVLLFLLVMAFIALQRRIEKKKAQAPELTPIEQFRKDTDSLLALAETREFEGKLIETTEIYLMKTLNIPKADFSKEVLSKASNNENINYIIKTLTELEMSEFGGSSSSENLMNKLSLLEKTKSLIETFNSEIK